MSFDCDEAWLNFCTNSDDKTMSSIIERETIPMEISHIPKCSSLYISTTTKISYFDKSIDLLKKLFGIYLLSHTHNYQFRL